MRTTTTQNVLYDYRYINLNKEIRYDLNSAFHLRKDFTKVEEKKATIKESLIVLAGVIAGVASLYFLMSYLV